MPKIAHPRSPLAQQRREALSRRVAARKARKAADAAAGVGAHAAYQAAFLQGQHLVARLEEALADCALAEGRDRANWGHTGTQHATNCKLAELIATLEGNPDRAFEILDETKSR